MSTLLRLYITDAWPAGSTECEWALHDARGNLLQRGVSEPRHWPAAERCELVLSAEQCLVLEAKLPKGVTSASSAGGDIIAYAVEASLAGDVENEHFVAGKSGTEGVTPVWVIDKARLRGLLGALQQIGRSPRRAVSELQLAPHAAGKWSVCLGANLGFVRTGAEAGFSVNAVGAEPPAAIRLALQAATRSGNQPESIDVYCGPGVRFDPELAARWQSALGIAVRRAGDYAWQTAVSAGARNLLTGEFAPKGERTAILTAFRPALALGALGLALYVVFSVGEWIWLGYRADALRAQTLEVFRAAFPQVQTIVDPSLQMQRLYDEVRRERGQLGEGDFLPMLAVVSDAVASQGRYRDISYEDGRLEFTVTLPDAPAADRVRDALARRGLTPTMRDSRPSGAGLDVSFSVRRGL